MADGFAFMIPSGLPNTSMSLETVLGPICDMRSRAIHASILYISLQGK
jgi:hypothetical protein